MGSKFLPEELVNMEDQLRDISIIAGRNVRGLLGIAEWIEETGHPRKAEAVRVMAHQLDEVVGELGTMIVAPE
jgi:hypothetical protein